MWLQSVFKTIKWCKTPYWNYNLKSSLTQQSIKHSFYILLVNQFLNWMHTAYMLCLSLLKHPGHSNKINISRWKPTLFIWQDRYCCYCQANYKCPNNNNLIVFLWFSIYQLENYSAYYSHVREESIKIASTECEIRYWIGR